MNVRLNQAPPVHRRPRCPQCNRALRPLFKTERSERVLDEHGKFTDYRNFLRWDGDYHAYGAFDTMRCAVDFANAVIAARSTRRR